MNELSAWTGSTQVGEPSKILDSSLHFPVPGLQVGKIGQLYASQLFLTVLNYDKAFNLKWGNTLP